jgi:1,4-alpha-glucan branching enzyme
MMKNTGYFSLVLHAHLPYVLGHGRWPHGMDWLNEAAAETYVPLLNVFTRLIDEGKSPKATIDISPVLAEMLSSGDFKTEFKDYLNQKKEAAVKDIEEFKTTGDGRMLEIARMWLDFYGGVLRDFTEKYGEDLIGVFRGLQDGGHIEIATCGATHGYFPLLSLDTTIQAQVKQAVASYRRHFGRDPRGIWLPECAYRPSYEWKRPAGEAMSYKRKGVEEFLSENRIEYFFIDNHLLRGGRAIGVYLDRFEELKTLWANFERQYSPLPEHTEKSPYKPYWVASSTDAMAGRMPVTVFTRDSKTGLQVWSGEWGYPGDGNYLEFHKKRFPGGLRYWKVTSAKSDLAEKEVYDPRAVIPRLMENAAHFKELIKENLRGHLSSTGEKGIVVSPYDCELFGHWWFEGPEWIYRLIKEVYEDGTVTPITAGEYLDIHRPREVVSIPEGSWGEGGYHWIWLNDMNKWTWKHIYEAEGEMTELASVYAEHKDDGLLAEIVKQAARELFLLTASDWQFLISTRAAADYAEARLTRHCEDFKRLFEMARKRAEGAVLNEADLRFLDAVGKRDNLFADIDPMWFKEVEFAAV